MDMSERMENILEKDERVVWTGKPVKSTFMFAETPVVVGLFFMAVSSLFLFVFTLFQPPIEMYLFILLFLVVGVLMTFVPPVVRLKRFPYMKYVVTNQRVIILSGKFAYNSVTLDRIQGVNVSEGFVDRLFGTGAMRVTGGPDFIALKNPDEVQKIIRETIQITGKPFRLRGEEKLKARCSICENLELQEAPRYPMFPPPEFPMPSSYKCKSTSEIMSRDDVETKRQCEHFVKIKDKKVLWERMARMGISPEDSDEIVSQN